MNVLVTAASKHGATREIAEAIAEALTAKGLTGHVGDPERVDSIASYDAVVVGSGIYAGRWLEAARRITERFHAELRTRPVWLFSSGPIGEPLAPTEEPADGLRLMRQLGAREHKVFPGRLNTDDLGWVERTITGMLKAPDGDFRDWHAIRAWADEIAHALRGEPAQR
jgi:menaquinone-dependent protoporphyrinogen oxidase